MLIRHLNLAFRKHGRWLFGIFTIVIIISFIGFMVPGQFGVGGCNDPMANAVGSAFGKPVTYNEAFKTLQNFLLANELMHNRRVGRISNEAREGFLLTAQLRAAREQGLAASDQEMADLIRRMAAFQKDGKFDPQTYKDRLEELRRNGISSQDLADALASMIILEKFQQEQMAAVTTTPGEARAFYDFFHETFQLRTAMFRTADYTAKVDTSDAAVKAFFDKNSSGYEIPAQLSALLIEFPYDDPAALAEGKKFTEKEVTEFYEKNRQAFADAKGNVPALAKIKAKVQAELAASKTRAIVNHKAQLFARDAYELVSDAREQQSAFAKLVAERKVKCIKTPVFAADSRKIGPLEEPELVKQLDLANPSAPVTNPVFGKRGAYVGFLLTREEKRPAKLEEVAAKVKADWIARSASEMAMAAARTAHDRAAALAPDKRTADPCWNGKGTFKLADYMFATAFNPELLSPMLAQTAVTLADNEVSEIVPSADGFVFAIITGRTPADGKEFEKDAELWKSLWSLQKENLRNVAFQQYLSENCQISQEVR